MSGGLLSPELYAQIAEMWRWFSRWKQDSGNAGGGSVEQEIKQASAFNPLPVITDEEIGGTFFAPESGLVRLCDWPTDTNAIEQRSEQLVAWNVNGEAIEVDTPCAAIPIKGRLVLFPACNALESRPAPPT